MEKIQIRITKYIVGLFIMTIGISVAIKSNLGGAPVSTVPYALTLITGLEMGLGTMGFQTFLVLLQIPVLRKKFRMKRMLQIPVSIVFGWMTTFSNYLIGFLPDTDFLPVLFAMVALSCFLIAFGLALYVPSDIIPLPTEGLITAISEVSGKAFSNIKVYFDCAVVSTAGLLCLCFTRSFGSIGAGTVILAIMVGIVNKQILKLMKKNEKMEKAAA